MTGERRAHGRLERRTAPGRWPVLHIIWRAGGWRAAAWAATTVAGALLTIAGIVAFGRLVGAVPEAAGEGLGSPDGRRLIILSLEASAVFFALHALAHVATALDRMLGRRVEAQLQCDALARLDRVVGLAPLEDAGLRDALDAVREVETAVHPAGEVVRALRVIALGLLAGVGAMLLLATFHWWVPLVLMLGWVLQDLWGHVHHETLEGRQRELDQRRRYAAYRSWALDPPAAKEVRVFGLGDWVAARADGHWREAMSVVWRQRKAPRWLVLAIVAAQFCANAFVFWLVARAGVNGEISVERVAVYLTAGLAGPLANLLQPYAMMTFRHAARPIRLMAALELPDDGVAPLAARADVDSLPRTEVRIEGLRFRYPGSERDVLAGLDLRIPAGRSVAIVGENGAGKTTLIKLLARLYEPDEGAILVDGRPLASIDAVAWRRRFGVVFQDFVRYPLALRDNVTFGRPAAADADAHLARALADSGLEPLIASLSDGVDTVLAREFGGTDLSGGQWQRIALARGLFAVQAGAGLLILDEPTASLDARVEAELFERFLRLTRGTTTVLVSHRFSTVRHVDLIFVLEDGRVLEHGSHEELVARGGRYAEMFSLQASRFADRPTEPAADA